jgi:hypothetical protein
MKRTAAVLTLAAATLILLAGCTAGSGSSTPAGPAPAIPIPQNGGTQEGGTKQGDAGSDAADPTKGLAAGDQVITSGWISMTVGDPTATSNDAVTLVEQKGGHIDNRTEQAATDSQPASAQLTIRVPADAVDETLEALKKLGHVESVSLNQSDVTAQVNDLDARISAYQASVARLQALLSSAASVSDLVELETALSTRQADLDSLVSQRTSLGDQVDYSTIDLQLLTKGKLPSGAPGDFWGGLGVGWAALVAAAGGVTVAFGVALPWLVILAAIAAVILLIVRLSTRKKTRTP